MVRTAFKALALIAALALAACETSKPEPAASAPGATTKTSIPADAATLAHYRTLIADARMRHPYPETADRMYAVMMCESRGQSNIVNPGGQYTGLFQYTSVLWKDDWNAYRNQPITDPNAQILATALAWNKGMQSHWGCYKTTK